MNMKEREARPLLHASSTTTDEISDEATVATTLLEEYENVLGEENNDEEQQLLPSLGTQETPLGDPVHVILLLIDPKTRRFELFISEFDPTAKVSDVINTFTTDKSEEYNSLPNLNSEQLYDSELISEYVNSPRIIIAVPSSSGESPEAITKQATTILTNPKVQNKLATTILTNPKVQKIFANADLDLTDLSQYREKKALRTRSNSTKNQSMQILEQLILVKKVIELQCQVKILVVLVLILFILLVHKEPPATIVKVVKEKTQKAKTPLPHMGHKLQINSSAFTANDFECLQLDTGNWPSERVHCELQAGSEFIYDFVVEHFDDAHCKKPNAKLAVVRHTSSGCFNYEQYNHSYHDLCHTNRTFTVSAFVGEGCITPFDVTAVNLLPEDMHFESS